MMMGGTVLGVWVVWKYIRPVICLRILTPEEKEYMDL
jgi:hypothetical protein